MKSHKKIDLSKLKPIEYAHFFITLEKSKCEFLLNQFPKTLQRAKMSAHFLQQMGWQDDIEKAEGYFRASLCELVSMEEIFRKEFSEEFSIFSTHHPLLILLKLIRNLEVHIKTEKLSKESKQFLWGSPQKNINFDIFVINKISIDDLKQLHGYSKFKEEEKSLIDTLDWFNMVVFEWGIVEIIFIAIYELIIEMKSFVHVQNK